MRPSLVRLWQLLLVLTLAGGWETAARTGWIDPFNVSMPSRVAAQIGAWWREGHLLRHVQVTLVETVLGFGAGSILGVALGVALAVSPRVALVADPFFAWMNALPRIVLAPLFVLWLGLGLASKVVMAASLVVFVVFFAVYAGLRDVDRDLVNQARVLGASRGDLVRYVFLPSALAWIFASLRTSVGLALTGAVVGEYLGAHEGMGWLIYFEESMFRSTGVIAGLAVLMAIVAVIDAALTRVERRFAYWKGR